MKWAAGILGAILTAGCGSTAVTTTTTVTQAARPVSMPVVHRATKPKPRPQPTQFTSCGYGVRAKTATTTCPFALDTAIAYSGSLGGDTEPIAYSPAANKMITTHCSGKTTITCTAPDGSLITFPSNVNGSKLPEQYPATGLYAKATPAQIEQGLASVHATTSTTATTPTQTTASADQCTTTLYPYYDSKTGLCDQSPGIDDLGCPDNETAYYRPDGSQGCYTGKCPPGDKLEANGISCYDPADTASSLP